MANQEGNVLPFFQRPDLSPFLVHLTRNTKETDRFSAFDNLVSILAWGKIHGSTTESGFIKGKSPATCFMDVPLSSLKYVLNESNTDPYHPRYEAFGIVVRKNFAYKHGCRPVLYLSDKEVMDLKIPSSELWRVVRLEGVDGVGINWLHEREWRCKGDFKLPATLGAVLVQTTHEAEKLRKRLQKSAADFATIPRTILPLEIVCQGLPYLAR